jgi:CDP-diacylglycerol--serine O-phosphatidyltransferase
MSLPHPMRRKDDHPAERRRMRRGLYILPSFFTALNIAAGYYAIAQVLQGSVAEAWHFDYAAKAIGVAIVADGLDGRIARLTGTTSDFGRELDSLADVITFGVAPAILAWMWGFRVLSETWPPHVLLGRAGAIATFLFLIAGAARLARFNIQRNPQPSNPGRPERKYFVGMPIPAGAGVICATVHFNEGGPLTHGWESSLWLALVLAAAFLMVSTWRFYSFKDIHLHARHSFRLIILICGLFALGWFFSRYLLFVLALAYMLSGVLARLGYVIGRGGAQPVPAPTSGAEASELR